MVYLILALFGVVFGDEGDGSSIVTPFTCGSALAMDFAEVRFNVKRYDSSEFIYNGNEVYLMATNNNCYDCAQSYVLGNFSSNGADNCASLLTSYSWTFTLYDQNTGQSYSSITRLLGEYGVYNLTAVLGGVSVSDDSYISVSETHSPNDAYLSVGVTIAVFAFIIFLSFCLPWCRFHCISRDYKLSLFGIVLIGEERAKKVAFEDEKTPAKSSPSSGVESVETTPATVVSDTDGGIWKYRQSMDGELSTPLMSRADMEEGDIHTTLGAIPSRGALRDDDSPISSGKPATVSKKPPRLACLDAFRGMAIVLMIFVNYGGGGYYFFDHAPWNGLTVADLLFPWFIWIMGTSMAISMKGLHAGKGLREECRQQLRDEEEEVDRKSGENVPMLGGSGRGGGDGGGSHLSRQDWKQWWKIIRRSVILFCIGLFLNGDNDLATYRIPGVLQYFAIANLVVAGTILLLKKATCKEIVRFELEAERAGLSPMEATLLPPRCSSKQEVSVEEDRAASESILSAVLGPPIRNSPTSVRRTSRASSASNRSSRSDPSTPTGPDGAGDDVIAADFGDEGEGEGEGDSTATKYVRHYCCPALLNAYDPRRSVLWCYRYECLVMVVIWVVYVSLCLWAKAPGCPRGYNGAGGLGNDGQYPECTGGIHRYIDVSVFGEAHIYQEPTCKQLYGCTSYDPEGLLGSLTAITLTYTGVFTGRILVHFKLHEDRLKMWLSWGGIFIFIAACLCGFTQNSGVIPVNKNLWSASFGLLTGGGGMLVLSAFYFVIDMRKWWSGMPLVYLGLNPILLFCAHECFQEYFPFSWYVSNPTHGDMMAMNIIGTGLWTILARYWYQKKFFVKI
jgi:predicted acyltransferase